MGFFSNAFSSTKDAQHFCGKSPIELDRIINVMVRILGKITKTISEFPLKDY